MAKIFQQKDRTLPGKKMLQTFDLSDKALCNPLGTIVTQRGRKLLIFASICLYANISSFK